MEPQQYRPTLLDLPISVFKTRLDNLPEGVTTLRRIVSRESNRPAIEAIRAEPDKVKQKEKKNQLRAFTSVSLLHHRKKDTSFADKIAVQWPMLAGDVDKSDNPGIDMAELKARISALSFVLLCAYSVRGGLWFVVRLPDGQTPDTLAGHFRYLQQLFGGQKKDGTYYGKFGVTLDSSKGGNPTDLRYVSYDAAPYINDATTVMAKTYTPPKPKLHLARQRDFSGPNEGELLTRLVRYAEGAGEGNRHTTLIRASTVAGGYVAAGRLDEQTAIYGLETVASEWPSFIKSQKTIRDGIQYGMAKPIPYDPPYEKVSHPPTRPAIRVPDSPDLKSTLIDSGLSIPIDPPRPRIVLNGETIYGDLLAVEPTDSYPAEWDTISLPDEVPTGKPEQIRPLTFFEWQRQHPAFSQMGLASLTKT